MNNINITIELSKDDRQLLEGLMGSITLLASVVGNAQPKEVQRQVIEEITKDTIPVKKLSESTDADATAKPPIEVPNEVEAYTAPIEEPTPVADPTPEVKPVSLAEFQKAVTLAVSKGPEAKKAVKTIINKYASSVSAVPEDKRADIIAELANI